MKIFRISNRYGVTTQFIVTFEWSNNFCPKKTFQNVILAQKWDHISMQNFTLYKFVLLKIFRISNRYGVTTQFIVTFECSNNFCPKKTFQTWSYHKTKTTLPMQNFTLYNFALNESFRISNRYGVTTQLIVTFPPYEPSAGLRSLLL